MTAATSRAHWLSKEQAKLRVQVVGPIQGRAGNLGPIDLVVAMNHSAQAVKRYDAPKRGIFEPETHLRRLRLYYPGLPVRQNSDHTAVPPEIAR